MAGASPHARFMVMSMCRSGAVFALTVGDIDPRDPRRQHRQGMEVRERQAEAWTAEVRARRARGVRAARNISRRDSTARDALPFPTGAGTALTVTGFYRQIWMPALRRWKRSPTTTGPAGICSAAWCIGRARRLRSCSPDSDATPSTGCSITRHTGISWCLRARRTDLGCVT